MYADAMTKRNGNVPLLQMLMRTGRICTTEESVTLEKHKSDPSSRSSSSKTSRPGDACRDGCSTKIVSLLADGFSSKIDQYLLMGVRVSVCSLNTRWCVNARHVNKISKPKEVSGSCQQLCAHVGSIGFVCLRHLSCIPSCRGFSHTVSSC